MPPPRPTALQSYSRPRIPLSEPSRNAAPANTSRKRAISLLKPPTDETPSQRELSGYISRVLLGTSSATLNGLSKPSALPPLTFRNDIDTQLYGLIAIIVQEFVISWYEPLTPDREFIAEVVGLVAHCSREIEARIRGVDWIAVLGDEVPMLVERHVATHRQATRYSLGGETEVRRVYGTLSPHEVLCPNGRPLSMVEPGAQHTERRYRTSLVLAILGIVLPVDELRNPCLTAMLADVIGDLNLGSVVEKFSQGSTYWEIIARLGRDDEVHDEKEDRLEKFGLLARKEREGDAEMAGVLQRFTKGFWTIGHVVFTLVTVTWAIMVGLFNSRNTDERDETRSRKPVLRYSLFSMMVSTGQLERRVPWLTGGFALLQHYLTNGPGRIAASGHIVDNYLRDIVHEHVLNADIVAPVLQIAREAVFPNNKMGQAKQALTAEEQVELREVAANTILSSIPAVVQRRLFRAEVSQTKTEDEDDRSLVGLEEIKEILDLFSDPMCMKLLLYNILELLIEKLFPELKLKGGTTILAEKTGSIDTL